jgi:poly [ADP-ribose] polymerase
MVESAQQIMDNLVPLLVVGKHTGPINDKLLELYRVIPRKMKKTYFHLIDARNPSMKDMPIDRVTTTNMAKIEHLIADEQATLDVMRGQVKVVAAQKKSADAKKSETILEAMGLGIVVPSDKDVQLIKKFLGRNAHQYRKAFRVINKRTQAKFDKNLANSRNKTVRQYWHGSRNENWWSIMDSGLILRPTNAVITGKMFGYGIYFADKAQKSIGYSSLRGSYWTGGRSNKGFLSLFDVHLGHYLKIQRHQQWCYSLNKQNLRKRGNYDSLYAEGGADLRNNEYIVYDDAQCTIKFLVEIG